VGFTSFFFRLWLPPMAALVDHRAARRRVPGRGNLATCCESSTWSEMAGVKIETSIWNEQPDLKVFRPRRAFICKTGVTFLTGRIANLGFICTQFWMQPSLKPQSSGSLPGPVVPLFQRGCTMIQFANSVKRFLVSEDGPTAVEYAVMLALIIVVCLTAIQAVGTNASSTFSNVSGQLGGS
jgi:pilus assembly protein Flp/PilA